MCVHTVLYCAYCSAPFSAQLSLFDVLTCICTGGGETGMQRKGEPIGLAL